MQLARLSVLPLLRASPAREPCILRGDGGTFGSYELIASLVNDIDGDRRVSQADKEQIQSLLNTTAEHPQYQRAADATLDGRITGRDLSLLVHNLGAAANNLSALEFTVNPAVTPSIAALPRVNPTDLEPRTMSRLATPTGEVADFVDNELYLLTNDAAELSAFLTRWNGTILAEVRPAELGYPELANAYLVHLDTTRASTTRINTDLLQLEPNAAFGSFEVSSQRGLELLAIFAQEAAQFGTFVGVSWIGEPATFLDRQTIEAPDGDIADWVFGENYIRNSWNWEHLGLGTTQNIGVTEVWLALNNAGVLERVENAGLIDEGKLEFAVFDNGFVPNEDWPDWIPFPNLGMPFGLPTPWPGKEWHGTTVVQAGAALPDNEFGAAGPGGPVMNILAVPTTYDPFFTIAGLVAASTIGGADIVNMSWHIPVPALLNLSVLPFDLATALVHESGTLIFAAAGNEGRNIDAEVDLLLFSFESFWYTPAENAGVIAVGGLSYGSRAEALGNTNYGREDVDIFAPFYMEVGTFPPEPIPGPSNNVAFFKGGTSLSAPFTAGVAAMIWAADPELTAGQVEDVLLATAHVSDVLRGRGQRYVNAFGAIELLLGDTPPGLELLGPPSGQQFVRFEESVSLRARAADVEGPPTITWSSDRDGSLGSGSILGVNSLSYGAHTITATATDSIGQTTSRSLTVEIITTDPVLTITSPADGATIEEGQIQFTARTFDNDYGFGPVPNANVDWFFLDPSGPFWLNFDQDGHGVVQSFTPGDYRIRAQATDGFGGSAEQFLDITVTPSTSIGQRPTAQIFSPANNTVIYGEDYMEVDLDGIGFDAEDGRLTGATLVWTTDRSDLQDPLLGTGTNLRVRLYTGGQGALHRITLIATDSDGNTSHPVIVEVLAAVLI